MDIKGGKEKWVERARPAREAIPRRVGEEACLRIRRFPSEKKEGGRIKQASTGRRERATWRGAGISSRGACGTESKSGGENTGRVCENTRMRSQVGVLVEKGPAETGML